MTHEALWQQNLIYPAHLDRQLIARIWPGSQLVDGMHVTTATGREVTVAAGAFVVALAGGMGAALCIAEALETVTFPPPPAGGSDRWDFLVVQVRDQAIDTGDLNGWTFEIVSGEAGPPGANPAPPVPENAGVLAEVLAHGGQANLAPADIYPVPRGGTGVPVGTVITTASLRLPYGWLRCEGQAVGRLTYPALFDALGASYGAGDGSTTFNLPDLRSSFVVGAGWDAPPGLNLRPVAQRGGEEVHALTEAELTYHTHAPYDPTHGHNVNASGAGNGNGSQWPIFANEGYFGDLPVATPSGTGVSGYATGGSNGHNTMPPFLALLHLIKF